MILEVSGMPYCERFVIIQTCKRGDCLKVEPPSSKLVCGSCSHHIPLMTQILAASFAARNWVIKGHKTSLLRRPWQITQRPLQKKKFGYTRPWLIIVYLAPCPRYPSTLARVLISAYGALSQSTIQSSSSSRPLVVYITQPRYICARSSSSWSSTAHGQNVGLLFLLKMGDCSNKILKKMMRLEIYHTYIIHKFMMILVVLSILLR